MNKKMHITEKFSLGLLGFSLAAATQGWAQEGSTAQKARGLEEVIVTAQRRDESVQVVPLSITAFSSDTMRERQITSLGDLTKVVPGIRFVHAGGGGNMNVVMRGLARIPLGTAPNAVINYFADVPLNFQGSNIPTYDLENIQVLKGPQGTLFGRNAIGGAVVITPQTPTYELGGYLKGAFGNYNFHDVEGALNVPLLDDKLALRVAAKSARREGYTKNMGAGNDQDDLSQDSFRASLLFEPIDSVMNLLIFDYFKADEAGTGSILAVRLGTGLAYAPIPALAPLWHCHTSPNCDIDLAFLQQQAWGPRKTTSEFDQLLYRKQTGVSNRSEWEINRNLTLRNIAGYRVTQIKTDLNTDGVSLSPFPIITASNRANIKQLSDEFHVFGNVFDDSLEYLVGAFYIKEEPNGPVGYIFPVASPVAPWVESYETKTNKAIFTQLGYDLSPLAGWLDGFKLNAGVRRNWTQTSLCTTTSTPTNFQTTPMPPIGEGGCPASANGTELDYSEAANTWNFGLDWRINENLFAYATHRRGFREGGINAPGFKSPCTTGDSANCFANGLPRAAIDLSPYQTYGSETLTDWEIGLKSNFTIVDIPVRFNISAYQGDYDNVTTSFNTSAVIASSDPSAPQSSSVGINTGKRTLSGFETELVVALTPDLTLTNTAAYVHQKIDEAPVPPIPGLQAPSLDPVSPQWSTSVAVRWVTPFRPLDSELAVNADWYYQEGYFVGNGELPGYDVTSLRVEWKDISQSGVDAAFFMRNVFDQEYPYATSATSSSLGIYTLSYAEPRMFGLELKYSFGR